MYFTPMGSVLTMSPITSILYYYSKFHSPFEKWSDSIKRTVYMTLEQLVYRNKNNYGYGDGMTKYMEVK